MSAGDIERRVEAVDWARVSADLDAQGWAILPELLSRPEADAIAALYPQDGEFRSRVVMARHGFGRGEYKYFSYPLPGLVQALRASAYPHLAPIANAWQMRLRQTARFPDDHAAFLARCHAAGQLRPTPLLLEYGPGDYNCLHRDLYGEHVFPLQIAMLLSEPGEDFTGGEFVMTEQRPRMQTRAMVLPLRKGDGAVFAVAARPVKGVRGDYQVKLNHGVSQLRAGHRHTLGVIFHDAV
ncbi:MAG TPA: 2OG-Fe(II) oxygenase [Caulobacteraceae bacterium]|nr:2OG-Fe(II) oxygenase [Caulobacteraceae bacterium]